MRSWHDFNLIGYAVDGKRQEMSLELECPSESDADIRHAKVCFNGVECYYLEHDLGINIVYAIEEAPLSTHLEIASRPSASTGGRNFGGHGPIHLNLSHW
jgi:hypothetical protein